MSKQTIHQGKYLNFIQIDNWEYAERANSSGCVAVLAITDQQEIVLVEQFRVPVNCSTIELTAGLIGDEKEFIDESITESANRELIEETGYSADKMDFLLTTPSSAGLGDEIIHIFLGTNLTKVGDGGGVAHENIIVHHVPMQDLHSWHLEKVNEGMMVDCKIFAALELAKLKKLL